MMIKRLAASFGRLRNDTLTLNPGLNIIQAPNECGKSTWCAFIKAMLYGIRTGDRDKAGYLSDKTRYRPWSGAPMAGTMEIRTRGDDITLERKTDGRAPMKDFTAVYTGTGEPYPGLTAETAGEMLTGVSEAVFERSAYMSQAGIRVTQTPELEKRIAALVTTGDEGASYSEIDERLRAWLRKRRFNKSGTIPALEEQVAGLGRTLSAIEAAVEESAGMRLEIEKLEKRRGELESAIKLLEKHEARELFRRAGQKLASAKAAYDSVYAQLTQNGPAPDEAFISAVRGELKVIQAYQAVADAERKKLEENSQKLAILNNKLTAATFGDSDPMRIVARAEALEADISRLSYTGLPAVATMLLTVLAAAAAFYAVLRPTDIPLLLPAAAAAALLGAGLLVWRGVRRRGYQKDLRRLLDRHNAGSAAALKLLAQEHAALSASARDAGGDVRSAETSLASAAARLDAARESLRNKLSPYSISPDPDTLERELDRYEKLLQELNGAKIEMQTAEHYMETLRQSGGMGDEDGGDTAPPDKSRGELLAELEAVTRQLDDLTRRYNMTLGEIRALGDPVILGSEKKMAEQTLNEHKAQYEALTLAVETLKEANNELQSRFSPLLGETAGRIIRCLTSGRYEKLTFDKTLDAFAKTAGETVSRNILALSAGTADQIYLALRLAVCELVLPAEDPCPLILDDTLTNFDDDRAKAALDYLTALSETRQILLFTCHGREASYVDASRVNIVRL
jgi:uncharacterized protein YhaN